MPPISAHPAASLLTSADAGALNAALRCEPDSRFHLLPRLLRHAGFYQHRAARAIEALLPASAPEVSRTLAALPALEPQPRGRQLLDVPVPAAAPSAGVEVRQGHLGDCWFIAALAACEHAQPGFISSRIRWLPNGLAQVRLHTGLRPRWVTISAFVPARHRAGDARGRANWASLVEKAAAVSFGRGSYTGLQHGFAGNAFYLLTGRLTPARPVPGLQQIRAWLNAGRPVVASTLTRRRSVRLIGREDDPSRHIAVMNGHVYVVCGVAAVDEDGRPRHDGQPRTDRQPSADAVPPERLRIHVRNPLGGRDPRPGTPHPRRTDLFLSEAQFRRIFLSVNVGPPLR